MLIMAESRSDAKISTDAAKATIFHEFLGRSSASSPSQAPVNPAAGDDTSPTASVSVDASSGGGRGPISAASDLGSEKQVTNHLEGIPFYGPGSDLTGTEMSYRSAGNKRSILDSAFMGSSRDGFPQIRQDSADGMHLMKILRNAGAERPRHTHDEAMFLAMHPLRPTSTLLLSGSPSGSKTEMSGSKWEQAIPLNVGPTVQNVPRVGQIAPFSCQTPPNRFKDGNGGPSVVSQSAADEGSRTGIKGSGILSSISGGIGVSDRIPSGVLLSNRKNFGPPSSLPESSASPSQHGFTSGGRQMTIFYGGQAHVFDDVHQNKADVIMALAGSNGGSWSTSYAKSAAAVTNESHKTHGGNDTGMTGNYVTSGDLRGRLAIMGTSTRGFGTGDQISIPSGGHQGGTFVNHGENPVGVENRTNQQKREA